MIPQAKAIVAASASFRIPGAIDGVRDAHGLKNARWHA